MNAISDSAIFVNKHFGAVNGWERIATNAPTTYSRSLTFLPKCNELLIVGAGTLPTKHALLAHKVSFTQLAVAH